MNTSAQVGGALGLAVLATLAATRTHALAAHAHGGADALTGGYHLGFLVAALLMLAAVVVGLVALKPERRSEPDRRRARTETALDVL